MVRPATAAYQDRNERQSAENGRSKPARATYQRAALLLRSTDVLTTHETRASEPPVTRRERRTFAFDSIRIATDGVGVSLIQTVTLVIAIKVFAAPDALKSLLASAANIGQLASLFVTAALARRAIRPNSVASAMGVASAVALAASAVASRALGFSIFLAAALMLFQLRLPFIAAIHEHNYPAERRGRRFSVGLILLVVVSLVFDLSAGQLLEIDLEWYRTLLAAGAAMLLVGGLALAFVPSRPAPVAEGGNPFRNLRILKTDRLFRRFIIAWFILGFSNLWTVPLRVVYLAEAERGLGLSPLLVMIIGGVIPQLTRLALSRVWANLFDRLHLVRIRIILAAFLGTGIFLYFLTESLAVVIAGQVLINVAFSGGPVLWNLWVTRIAPPGRSSIYMSVHIFMTGIRGTLAPAIGFLAVAGISFRLVGTISLLGILAAIAILTPMRHEPRAAPPNR